VLLSIFIVPRSDGSNGVFVFSWVATAVIFCVLMLIGQMITKRTDATIEQNVLYSGETALLSEFIERMRFCYSLDDFYNICSEVLEQKGDCSILYIDCIKNYVLYNSPDKITCSKETMDTLSQNFPESWKNGFFFMGENLGIVTTPKYARGFFLSNNGHHLYVFCRYTHLFDVVIYPQLFEEFCRFQNRTQTISDLSEIASLSKEWEQLADTQRSFLPAEMPKLDKLSVAAYFRPLVNVSGDYYSVLPIDKDKTLLMLGDVSGKGLAAALVMGLVMNTVKILEDKDDLVAMIRAVDKAIKGMKLQDKYTVLFIGIVDTSKMTIRYINASMSDPLIITKAPEGYRIKPLSSNCSLVGIIDLPDVEIAEQRLFRGDVILMASDGVSEVMDDSGVELGTTELYTNTIKNSASKSPQEFIDDVVNLVMSYNGDKKLRDDVTMMVAKVER
jgi:serine phosphatase RsbU (regulator of sigma subunit)